MLSGERATVVHQPPIYTQTFYTTKEVETKNSTPTPLERLRFASGTRVLPSNTSRKLYTTQSFPLLCSLM